MRTHAKHFVHTRDTHTDTQRTADISIAITSTSSDTALPKHIELEPAHQYLDKLERTSLSFTLLVAISDTLRFAAAREASSSCTRAVSCAVGSPEWYDADGALAPAPPLLRPRVCVSGSGVPWRCSMLPSASGIPLTCAPPSCTAVGTVVPWPPLWYPCIDGDVPGYAGGFAAA